MFERIISVVALVVGLLGSLGQSYFFYHRLVNTYPYKMMGLPPASFYAMIGNVGLYLAPILSISLAIFLSRHKRYLVAPISVFLCPLFFWLTFEILHMLNGYYDSDRLWERNFDHYSGQMLRHAFAFDVLVLMFWGTAIGSLVAIPLWYGQRLTSNRTIEE